MQDGKLVGAVNACDFGRPDEGLRHFHGKYGSINSERYAWQECRAYFSIFIYIFPFCAFCFIIKEKTDLCLIEGKGFFR